MTHQLLPSLPLQVENVNVFFSVPYLVSAASAVVRRITELPALARTNDEFVYTI